MRDNAEAEPLLLLGDTQRRNVERLLGERARQWCEIWTGRGDVQFVVEVLPAPQIDLGRVSNHATRVFSGRCGDMQVTALCADGFERECLSPDEAVTLSPQIGVSRCAIADALCGRMVGGLIGQVLETTAVNLSLTSAAARDALQLAAADRRWCVRLGRLSERPWITLIITAAAMARLRTTPANKPTTELIPRHQALSAEKVRLVAVLGSVDLDVQELSQLAVGDVLLLPAGADEKVAIQTSQGVDLGLGQLCRSEAESRAVSLSAFHVAPGGGPGARQAAAGGARK
jgi:flagellar motor switch/type III secretory pathway protein FliN